MNIVIRFPLKRVAAVLVTHDDDGCWLAICGSHGWRFGSRDEAWREAEWLSCNRGLPVREVAS
jgi:hypothetical protein